MGSIKMPAICVAVIVMLGFAHAQQPTSFNFDRIRYTFYPGEVARTWTEANAFCKSLGKELAVFANRAQVRNVSEYLSPEGGVWTGYKTNNDGKFESVELAEFEWKKEFGTPLLNKAKPKLCGLLSVANYTGIVATDCSTKKAALCSLSNPDAIEAETIRDGKANAEQKSSEAKPSTKSTKVSTPTKETNSTAAKTPTSAPKATSVKPAKVVTEKESEEITKDAKPKNAKASTPAPTPKPSTPAPISAKTASKSAEKTAASAEKKPANAEKKPTSVEDKPVSVEKKPASTEKKPVSEEKSDYEKSAADAKSKPAESKSKPKTAAKAKKDIQEEDDDEEKTPSPTTRPPTNQTPIQIESEGGRFTFFPNHIMFGGYMEYSRFCEDKGLQPAVFKSRTQLDDIASHVNSVVMVWTGYSTDSQGLMHSVDEANGPWQPEFEVAGSGASQSLMCGAMSSAANKVGITLNSCASAHEALCSAKTFTKKNQKK